MYLSKDTLHADGLSVFAIQKAYQYISYYLGGNGSPPMTTHQILALNMNCDNYVDALDISYIKAVLLGFNQDFLGCPAWGFIRADHTFENPYRPLLELYNDTLSTVPYYRTDCEESTASIIGIKRGDLAYEANPYLRNESLSFIGTLPETVTENMLISIPIRAENFNQIQGFQFELNIAPEVLEFATIQLGELPYVNKQSFNLTDATQGNLRMVWSDPSMEGMSYNPDAVLFTIQLISKVALEYPEDYISLNSSSLNAIAIAQDWWVQELDFIMTSEPELVSSSTTQTASAGFRLLQNYPNPFTEETIIAFELPSTATAVLSIYNSVGQLVQQIEGTYAAGRNEIKLSKEDLMDKGGLFYYNLKTPDFSGSKKMFHRNK